jgi:hypothetical protein
LKKQAYSCGMLILKNNLIKIIKALNPILSSVLRYANFFNGIIFFITEKTVGRLTVRNRRKKERASGATLFGLMTLAK